MTSPAYLESRYPTLVFGDGQFAQVLEISPAVPDEDGMELVSLRIRPTPEMMQHYKISPESLEPVYYTLIRRYPAIWVSAFGSGSLYNPSGGGILVKCTFDYQDTNFTKENDIETIKNLKKQVYSLRKANARLNYDMNKLMSQQMEYWNKVSDMVKVVRRAGGDINTEAAQMAYPQGGANYGQQH